MSRTKSKLMSFLLILSLFVGIVGVANVDTSFAATKKIHLKKTSISLVAGKTYQQKLIDKNGKTIKATKIKWKSSKTSVAKINKKGKITAVNAGTAKMTAKYQGKTYKFTVIVKAKYTELDNAYKQGKSYLKYGSFSRQALVDQLVYDKYPQELAEQAVQKLENDGVANWDAECYEHGTSYLKYGSFSKQGLIEQLEYSQYTQDQAIQAVQKLENDGVADWDAECYEHGASYLQSGSFSKQGLTEQLIYEKYTQDQVNKAVQKLEGDGISNWDAECYEQGTSYLKYGSFSKQELIEALVLDGFTLDQAERAANQLFQ